MCIWWPNNYNLKHKTVSYKRLLSTCQLLWLVARGNHYWKNIFDVVNSECIRYLFCKYCCSWRVSVIIYMYLFLNNQSNTLIIPILFCYKTQIYVSGIFSAHHPVFYSVHSALVSFMQVFDDCFETESALQFHPHSAWKPSSKTCMKLTCAKCTVENTWWWAEKMPETCRVL